MTIYEFNSTLESTSYIFHILKLKSPFPFNLLGYFVSNWIQMNTYVWPRKTIKATMMFRPQMNLRKIQGTKGFEKKKEEVY